MSRLVVWKTVWLTEKRSARGFEWRQSERRQTDKLIQTEYTQTQTRRRKIPWKTFERWLLVTTRLSLVSFVLLTSPIRLHFLKRFLSTVVEDSRLYSITVNSQLGWCIEGFIRRVVSFTISPNVIAVYQSLKTFLSSTFCCMVSFPLIIVEHWSNWSNSSAANSNFHCTLQTNQYLSILLRGQ